MSSLAAATMAVGFAPLGYGRYRVLPTNNDEGMGVDGGDQPGDGTGGVQCFDPSAPPLHQWTQYTIKDGLGDDNGYAIACDRQGRIWVGHLNHGVSVFNHNSKGRWQCYEVVAGLSRPDTLSGPIGERVFAIKCCPTDGDVWIATNCGLARYSDSKQTWTYLTRADGLPSESLTATGNSTAVGEGYSDTYTYDLAGNRTTDAHAGPGDGASGTTTYAYNGDDQLTQSASTVGGTTTYTYDANGSQLTSTNGSTVTTYTFDVRNKMATATVNGTTTTYVYDDAGDRVRETAGGATAYYLTDGANPTGYAQPLERRVGSPTAAPTVTYLIGDRVYGQVTSAGASYFLTDGHGSTVAMASSTGAVTATYAYTAYGDGLNFTLGTAATRYLFGGDAVYDAASGLYLHGDGTRGSDKFRFVEADKEFNGTPYNPITLGKYLYANADPIEYTDPTGRAGEGETYATKVGKEVEKAIAKDFLTRAGQFGYTFKSVFGILNVPYLPRIGRLFPDLVWYNPNPIDPKKEVFEIKPDNPKKILQGYAALATYVIALNKIDRSGGWQFGSWATYTPSFHTLETVDTPGFVIITQLPGGLIVYDLLPQYVQKKAESVGEAESEEIDEDVGETFLTDIA